MSHTIQLPDEVYEVIATYATRRRQTPEEVIAAWAAAALECEIPPAPLEGHHYSAQELMRLPIEERDRILAAAADLAAEAYASIPELTEFAAEDEVKPAARLNNPASDPWAGFRGITPLRTGMHRYMECGAADQDDLSYNPAEDPLADFLGKGELTDPTAIRRHDEAIAEEALDEHSK